MAGSLLVPAARSEEEVWIRHLMSGFMAASATQAASQQKACRRREEMLRERKLRQQKAGSSRIVAFRCALHEGQQGGQI